MEWYCTKRAERVPNTEPCVQIIMVAGGYKEGFKRQPSTQLIQLNRPTARRTLITIIVIMHALYAYLAYMINYL